jgi:hypothetical protein
MGIKPQAEKKESTSAENKDVQADDRGSKYKGGYKGRRFIKKKSSGSKDVAISKSKFKGALDALVDYYFDTGPTQAHDFKKTHKKISAYTGTKYSAEVMMSIEELERHDWTATMPRKPIKTDFNTISGTVEHKALTVPQEHLDRYEYKMKSHCKKEEDMKLSFTAVHGQCTDDILHELKCQQTYEKIKYSFDPVKLLKLIQQISYNYQAQDFPLMEIAKAQEAIYIEKQSQTESNIDYLLTFKNRAVVLEAVGGNLANDGVKKYMAQKLFSKEFNICSSDEKQQCATKGREAMLATVFLMKADKGRYSKLLDHLPFIRG